MAIILADETQVHAYLEKKRHVLILLPRQRNTLYICMFLLPETDHRFIENYPLIIFGMHTHEALHEVLSTLISNKSPGIEHQTNPGLIPYIVIPFQHIQVVLDRHDETMTFHQLFAQRATQINTGSHRNNGSFWK